MFLEIMYVLELMILTSWVLLAVNGPGMMEARPQEETSFISKMKVPGFIVQTGHVQQIRRRLSPISNSFPVCGRTSFYDIKLKI